LIDLLFCGTARIKAQASKVANSAKSDKLRLIMKNEYNKGIPAIKKAICEKIPNFPNAISEDETRRLLIAGVLVSEPRQDKKESFQVHVNSTSHVDTNVDIAGQENIADALNESSRTFKRKVKNGTYKQGEIFDKLAGRYYSCQTSVDNLKK
jgi:hypothetical protein